MKTYAFLAFVALVTTPLHSAIGQWTVSSGGFGQTLDLHAVGDDVIYACSGSDSKLYWSTNGGSTWVQYGTVKVSNYGNLSVHQYSDGAILVGTWGGGVYRSSDGGTTWGASTGDYSNPGSFAQVSQTLFSSRGYRSSDGGVTWAQLTNDLFTQWPPAECVEDGGVVYFSSFSGGVLYSSDAGASWRRLDTAAFQPSGISALASEGGTVVTGLSTGEVYAHSSSGWSRLGSLGAEVTDLVMSGGCLLAGTWNGKVYRCCGSAWTDVSIRAPVNRIRSLAINGRYVYAGVEATGVYRREISQLTPLGSASHLVASPGTVDFHDPLHPTWTTIDFTSLSGSGNVVVMHFGSPATNPQFSGTAPAHLSQYRWVIQQTGLVSFVAEVRFNVTPYLPGVTNPSSVTIFARPSEDEGQFEPLPTTYVGTTNEFRAITAGFSEFVLGSDDNLLTPVAECPQVPVATRLLSIWPNPSNPRTTIRYALPRTVDVRLTVYDIQGRLVTVLVDGKQEAGLHEVAFDASGLSSGMYFCRMEAGGSAETCKVLMLR